MSRLRKNDPQKTRKYLSDAAGIFREHLITSFHFLPENAKIQTYRALKDFENYYLTFNTLNRDHDQASIIDLIAFITETRHFVLNPYARLESMVYVTGQIEFEEAYATWIQAKTIQAAN